MQFKKIAFLMFSIIFLITGCDNKKKEEEKKIATLKKENSVLLQTYTQQNYNFEKINDKKVVIKELKDKIVLMNFWAVWCPPCKAEIPHLINLKDKYKDKFEILGINMGNKNGSFDSKEQMDSFLDEYKINYPIITGENNFKLAKLMDDVQIIPTMFLFDGKGNIIQKYVGVVPEEMLETDIKRILGK